MNERQERREASPIIGGSSLLVIFAVLCLTVFALLSLSTAQAEKRLIDASAQAVAGYYDADSAAEAILAQLRAGETPEGVTARGGGRYQYSCPISDSQTLGVEVQIQGGAYQVLRWQAVSSLDWQADEEMNVWNGDSDNNDETENDNG